MYRLFLFIFIFSCSNLWVHASERDSLFEESYMERPDGVTLRLVFMPAHISPDIAFLSNGTHKAVIFVPGRTSCFENNYDLALRLTGQPSPSPSPSFIPVDFWSLDHRGHGKSGGRLEIADGIHDQRCHIDSFKTYVDDFHQALGEIKRHYKDRTMEYYLVGMSMGGHIALTYLHNYEGNLALPFKRMILISPMVKFLTPKFPAWAAKALAYTATYCGFGECFIPGHGPRNLRDEAFETYTGSHNKEDFLAQQAFFKRHSGMLTEGATYGWIKAAFESVSALTKMKKSSVPIVAFLAGDDRHVDVPAADHFLKNLGAQIFVYKTAYHVLTREPEAYVPGFWEELFNALE